MKTENAIKLAKSVITTFNLAYENDKKVPKIIIAKKLGKDSVLYIYKDSENNYILSRIYLTHILAGEITKSVHSTKARALQEFEMFCKNYI